MQSGLHGCARGCFDGSRQPPTCGQYSLLRVGYVIGNRYGRVQLCTRLFRHPPQHRTLVGVIQRAAGNVAGRGSPRRPLTEDTSSEDVQQTLDTSWWQAQQRSESEAALQQRQPRQLTLSSTPFRRPAITPFPRPHADSTAIASIGPSDAINAGQPFFNRTLANNQDAVSAASTNGAVDAEAAQVLLPAAPPPGSAASPHSRAWGFVSTVASVAAVGAYVYTLWKRKQDELKQAADGGPMGRAPPGFGPGTAVSPPQAPKRAAGAGSGLFRPVSAPPAPGSKAAGATPGASMSTASVAAAAAAEPAGAATATASSAARPVAAAVARPARPTASPARERGWWRRLSRLYYISFGVQYGLVPRISLDGAAYEPLASLAAGSVGGSGGGGGSSAFTLVAFEDAADAEYVASVLWEDLVETGAQASGPRPHTMGVLSAVPIFLEDMAAMRGLLVDVVPSDGLRKDLQLGMAQLEVALEALLKGASQEEAAARAERALVEAAAAAAAAAAAEAKDGNGDAAGAGSRSSAVVSDGRGQVGPARPGTTAVRGDALRPLGRREGLKTRLPSKFDFPGFDAAAASECATQVAPPPQPASKEPLSAAGNAAVAAAPTASKAASEWAPQLAVAAEATSPSTQVVAGPPAAAPPPALPQVEPLVVREPVRGRGGDAEVDFSGHRPDPFGGRVIDAEAVEVMPAAAALVPAAAPAAIAVPSSGDADEAMREYRELERLLAMATGGGEGAGSGATRGRETHGSSEASGASRGALTDAREPWTAAAARQERLDAVSREEVFRPQSQQQQKQEQHAPPTERKSGAERAREIFAAQGPTDAAMEAALAALEEDDRHRRYGSDGDDEDNELLGEYYSIFNSASSTQASSTARPTSSSGRTTASGGSGSGSSTYGRSAGPSAAKNGSSGGAADLAAEVAEVQRQLAAVLQAVAAAHALGKPPPADAADNMRRLQKQLQDLQTRLAAASLVPPSPAAAASPSFVPTAATRGSGAASPGGSRQSGSLFSSPTPLRPTTSSSSSIGNPASNGSSVGAETAQTPPAPAVDAAAFVTPLSPPRATTAASTSAASPANSNSVGSNGKAGARRAWGAWKTNRRIQEAEATLLKAVARSSAVPLQPLPAAAPPPPASSSSADSLRGGGDHDGNGGPASVEEEGVVVLNKRVGSNRPPKVVEAPETRQDRVKEALRVFSQMGGDMRDDEEGEEDGDGDGDGDGDRLFGRSASLLAGGRRPWWQQRFQALFLPTIGYPDGSMGFLQVNVSLSDRRDMRVLAFEDRTDCTACLTLLAQWPEYEGTDPRVSMMPTDRLLQQLQQIYNEQSDLNADVNRPRGLAVFRRGKLPMRPGMGPDDFLQLVIYGHAAQVALARTGYSFNA